MNRSLFRVHPSSLKGSLFIPPSKSHTMRALFFSALASGRSTIRNPLCSPDTTAMIEAVRLFGANVEIGEGVLEVVGTGGRPSSPSDVVRSGNSGQVLRFIAALAALLPSYTVLTGDESLRSNRPSGPLLDALSGLGVFAKSALGNGYAPLIVKGPPTSFRARLNGADSQPVSALLMAGAFFPSPLEIFVDDPGEKPWVDLTLSWLDRLGIAYEREGHGYYRVFGPATIEGFTYTVPGDLSSLAFPLAAALVTGSELTLRNVDLTDSQGDKAIVTIARSMGAEIGVDADSSALRIRPSKELSGIRIDVNDCIDALPVLAVLGCFARGTTEIVNGRIAGKKESDRIRSIGSELRKMGALIEEKPDGLVIRHSKLRGAEVESHKDHRIALALTVAALGAFGSSTVTGVECIEKSYRSFYEDFTGIGASLCDEAAPDEDPKRG